MITPKTVGEILTIDNGLFKYMELPFIDSGIDKSGWDIDLLSQCNGKYITKLVELYNGDNEALAKYIEGKLSNQWEKMYDALLYEYNVGITSTEEFTREVTEENELNTSNEKLTKTNNDITDRKTGYNNEIISGSESDRYSNGTRNAGYETFKDHGKDKKVINTKDRTVDKVKVNDISSDTKYRQGHNSTGWNKSDLESSNGVNDTVGDNRLYKTGVETDYKDNNNSHQRSLWDSTNGTNVHTYNNRTNSINSTDNTNTKQTGQNRDMEAGDVSEKKSLTETYLKEGSSPLRTFPALILEEFELRTGIAGNFIQIVIKMVIDIITLDVYPD